MGTVYYGAADTPVEFEDRALAHLTLLISTKLRRGESFTLSWEHPADQPGGWSTLWLHPTIPLRFVFDDAEPATINRAWIAELADAAYRTGGIVLGPEAVDGASHDGGTDDPDSWQSES